MAACIDRAALLAALTALLGTPLALAGCETLAGDADEPYRATLSGAAEAPGPGDPDGAGTAEVTVDVAEPRLCYELSVSGIAEAAAAHIHRGAAGIDGPPVVTLESPGDGESGGCVSVTRELAAEIVARPANFYVNVHNAEFPAGAVRGQLQR